jgi:hypothetical protein
MAEQRVQRRLAGILVADVIGYLIDFDNVPDSSLGIPIFGPVDDIRAFDPLFTRFVQDLRQTVAMLGLLAEPRQI